MIDPKYLNFFKFGIAISPIETSPTVSTFFSLNVYSKYSVFDLVNLKPLESRASLQIYNLLPTPPLVLLAKSIHHGISSCISLVNSSITIVTREGLRAWCKLIKIGKS